MAEYSNTNSGALFKNDRKETEKHPDYRGSLNVEGTEYWMSAWLKVSKKGDKYMSIAVSAKDQNRAPNPQTAQADDFDDPLPF